MAEDPAQSKAGPNALAPTLEEYLADLDLRVRKLEYVNEEALRDAEACGAFKAPAFVEGQSSGPRLLTFNPATGGFE
jgi:hypothetical protein